MSKRTAGPRRVRKGGSVHDSLALEWSMADADRLTPCSGAAAPVLKGDEALLEVFPTVVIAITWKIQ